MKSVRTFILLLSSFVLSSAAVAPASGAAPAHPHVPVAELALLSNAHNIVAIERQAPPDAHGFSFIVCGDNRDGDATFAKVIAAINLRAASYFVPDRPRFVLHTGDIVPHGKLGEWVTFATLREQLRLPLVFCRGNHELKDADGASNYQRLVGNPNWAFDFGGCRFIGLDDATGSFSEDGITYLKQNLGTAGRKFVAFHEPPAVGRWLVHCVKPDDQGGRGGEVMDACSAARVSAVFLGHIHLYDEMDIGGVPYIISAGGGAPLYDFGFGKVEYGYAVVHVTPEKVSWEWVKVE